MTTKYHLSYILVLLISLGTFLGQPLAVNASENITTDIRSNSIQFSQPQILYSDLVVAPTGAYVTIWGQNISEDSTFSCGNSPCEIISFSNDNNHPPHGNQPARQKIVVRYFSGSGITLNGYNSLPFEVNQGKIWEATPSDNIASILDKMNYGDVLYLRGGTYSSVDPKSYGYRKGQGAIIWATEKRDGLAVIGYPGERVILDVSSGLRAFDTVGNITNWTIANIECSGAGWAISNNAGKCIGASRIGSRENFRVVGIYAHDLGLNGTGAFGEFSYTKNLFILGNFTDKTGTPNKKTHVIYHGGRGVNDNINIDYNRIRNHVGRRGIQIYGHKPGESMTNLRIRYNHIENNFGTDAILLSFSDSNSSVPRSDPKRNWIKNALIKGNTIYSSSGPGVAIRAAIADIIIENNVIYNNNSSIYIDFVKSAKINNNCLDKAPSIYQNTSVYLSNNKINYPHCLLR